MATKSNVRKDMETKEKENQEQQNKNKIDEKHKAGQSDLSGEEQHKRN